MITSLLFLGFTFGYLLFIVLIFIGLIRNPYRKNHYKYSVSVIIAAHNEEAFIERCVKAILAADYPLSHLEVIVVDDASTDNTASVVSELRQQNSQLHLVKVKERHPYIAPKKYALEQGISSAAGDIIVTTDADCVPPPNWIPAIVSCFTPEIGIVGGFSPLVAESKKNKFLSHFQLIESLGLGVTSAGTAGLGYGFTCSGRNLACRKIVFDRIDGFSSHQNIVSGDDDLLLHEIQQKTTWKFRYARGSETVVPSFISGGLLEFAHARIRHASKTKLYPLRVKFTALFIFIYNLLIPIAIAGSIISGLGALYVIAGFILKVSGEYLLLRKARGVFGYPVPLVYLPVISFLHALYLITFGVLGLYAKFKWKGQSYNRRLNK